MPTDNIKMVPYRCPYEIWLRLRRAQEGERVRSIQWILNQAINEWLERHGYADTTGNTKPYSSIARIDMGGKENEK